MKLDETYYSEAEKCECEGQRNALYRKARNEARDKVAIKIAALLAENAAKVSEIDEVFARVKQHLTVKL